MSRRSARAAISAGLLVVSGAHDAFALVTLLGFLLLRFRGIEATLAHLLSDRVDAVQACLLGAQRSAEPDVTQTTVLLRLPSWCER